MVGVERKEVVAPAPAQREITGQLFRNPARPEPRHHQPDDKYHKEEGQ